MSLTPNQKQAIYSYWMAGARAKETAVALNITLFLVIQEFVRLDGDQS